MASTQIYRSAQPNQCRRPASVLALGLMLLLTGCAVPTRSAAPLGTLHLAEAVLSPTTDDRHDYELSGLSDGTLTVSEWSPSAPPLLTLIAVHGFGDYGLSTFEGAAQNWAQQGIRTIAYDQRGFGRNPSNGNWPGADALIDDLAEVYAFITSQTQGPVAVIGHSMGGAVVAAALGEGRIDPERAVLLAPAFWGGSYLNPVFRGTAGLAAALFPNRRWSGRGVVRIQASDNIDALRALGRDPLYVGNPSSREFLGLIRLMDRAVQSAEAVETPVLVIYGAKDEVVPEEPIRATAERMPGLVDYQHVETGWHLLLRDLEAEIIHQNVAAFLLGNFRSD